ncbi:MAG: S8 family serine peptidase [Pseudomonadota bacterium]|nr:S8 family serine peptidase [Pseudomonadota bacterium]
MSDRSPRGFRTHALAAATAAVLSATLISAPAFAAGKGRVFTDGLGSSATHDQFIVKYHDGSVQNASAEALSKALDAAANGARGGKALGLRQVRRVATGAEVVRSSRKLDRVEAEILMRQLAADPNVEYVEVDQMLQPTLSPNDTYYASNQWHYFEAAGGIKADQAWDVTTGSGVVVAVLDTGITTHSDLGANILAGYDFISDSAAARDGNGRDSNAADQGDWTAANECGYTHPASNSSWHGTHVTGTVAAVTNNSTGVAGVAFGAKVVPVRVLGKCGGRTSDIADGIIWASGGSVSGVPANANPAEVINMSLGGGGTCSSTYQNAINSAVGRGTTVVVAAGNSNAETSGSVPANCSNVIAVASTTRTGARSSFSNYGSLIDVAAPGSDIASTINSGTTTPSTASYALNSGTSMAAPHVAGVVALMQAKASSPLTPAAVESTLKSTLRPFPVSIDKPIGSGIVNARAAVDAVGGSAATTYSNGNDYAIKDNATVESPIPVSGRTGAAPSSTPVSVNIVHTYIGDLKVDLVAPDGSVYVLHNRSGGSADNIVATYNVNLSSEAISGTWKLRVNDNYNGDTGYINSWSIKF